MRRAVTIAAALFAVALAAWLAVGPTPDTAVAPVPVHAHTPRPHAAPAPPLAAPAPADPEPAGPIPVPPVPDDLDAARVYPARDLQGLATALTAHESRVLECVDAWIDRNGPIDSQVVLDVRVPADPSGGEARATATLAHAWPDGDVLEACIEGVLADLRLEPPDDTDLAIVWPLGVFRP